jgi:hypothetical protein
MVESKENYQIRLKFMSKCTFFNYAAISSRLFTRISSLNVVFHGKRVQLFWSAMLLCCVVLYVESNKSPSISSSKP